MSIENETFAHYKMQKKLEEIRKSINLLRTHGYTIVDLENKIIEKEIKDQKLWIYHLENLKNKI